MKRGEYYDIRSVCIVRNGERCKDCVFYGIVCNKWKREHKNRKPCDWDPFKNDIMSRYPGLSQVYTKNVKKNNKKGVNNNGFIKKERNYHRNNQGS